ncbi:MAG: efflux RND transporter periplasmic adaptor subunit [Parvularculaceae bacterium]|nr:efflux RND transporter periplasmic adaptor subunit [Parvularculaceae bacterium]
MGMRPPPVAFAQPQRTPVEDQLSAIGTGRALQSLTLTADVSGIIQRINIKPGAAVKAGAPLVELEKREQEIALTRARAEYRIAKTNAQRFAGLRESEAASALEQEAAQNELTAATAALQQAEYDLERRTIIAPFDGVVGLTNLDVGDLLTIGATVTTIDDVSSLLVDFVVPEGASPFVTPGMRVTAKARAGAGGSVSGVVRAVDSRVDSASRTRRVEAVLDNKEGALIPGSTFEIALDVKGRTGFLVPGLAIQWDRQGSYVWRMSADGSAERVPVVILRRTESAVLVEGDLKDVDQIVSEGADLVRPGVPLRPPGRESASGGVSSR